MRCTALGGTDYTANPVSDLFHPLRPNCHSAFKTPTLPVSATTALAGESTTRRLDSPCDTAHHGGPMTAYHALVLNLHQPSGNLEHLLTHAEWEAKEILYALDRIPRSLW